MFQHLLKEIHTAWVQQALICTACREVKLEGEDVVVCAVVRQSPAARSQYVTGPLKKG